MIGYLYDSKTKKFIRDVQIDADPLESKLQNKYVPLMPANCTLVKPISEKEGFDIVWNIDHKVWEYKEIEKPAEEEQEYIPTEQEQLEEELFKTEAELQRLDYIGVKIATGRATIDEYSEQIEEMNKLANKINELRERLKDLEIQSE